MSTIRTKHERRLGPLLLVVLISVAGCARSGTPTPEPSAPVAEVASPIDAAPTATPTLAPTPEPTIDAPPTPRLVVPSLIVDGGFEDPVTQAEVTQLFGPTTFGAWTVTGDGTTGGGVDLVRAEAFTAAEGVQSVDLSALNPGGIGQVVDLPAGRYRLEYSLGGNPDVSCSPQGIKTGEVHVDGAVVDPFSIDTTGFTRADPGWRTRVTEFTVAGGSTRIEFISTTAGCQGPLIDAVVLVAAGG